MDATLLLRGAWVGVGWDVNVHLHLHTTWMLRCCYVGHGLGWGVLTRCHDCTNPWALPCPMPVSTFPFRILPSSTWFESKAVTAGTQTLDRAWQDLKKYVPSEITAKDATSKKVNPALWDWIYSWMWRRNCKGDVWAAMPALFH